MDDDDRTCLQEDAISLSDFPLDHHVATADSPEQTRRSSFEFLKDEHSISSDSDVMCSADDIIVCGKLMPFNPTTRTQQKTKLPLRSRSDSSSVFQEGSMAVKLTRSSRSVDGTTSYGGSVGKPEFGRTTESKKVGTMTRPRWYFYMMFGVAKFQTETELRDIRTRQLRRTAVSSVDSQVVGGEKFPANRSGWGGGSWKLLKALSCKDHASVAVAT